MSRVRATEQQKAGRQLPSDYKCKSGKAKGSNAAKKGVKQKAY